MKYAIIIGGTMAIGLGLYFHWDTLTAVSYEAPVVEVVEDERDMEQKVADNLAEAIRGLKDARQYEAEIEKMRDEMITKMNAELKAAKDNTNSAIDNYNQAVFNVETIAK